MSQEKIEFDELKLKPYVDKIILKSTVNKNGCWELNIKPNDSNHSDHKRIRIYAIGKNFKMYAHRLIYLFYNGIIKPGEVIRHNCDNAACINPDHLKAGTQTDNIYDGILRKRIYQNIKKEFRVNKF